MGYIGNLLWFIRRSYCVYSRMAVLWGQVSDIWAHGPCWFASVWRNEMRGARCMRGSKFEVGFRGMLHFLRSGYVQITGAM